MNLFLRMSFKGSDFYGTQRQAEYRTVQSLLEETLTRILGQQVEVKLGSRLDRGVSALDLGANFKIAKLDRSLDKLKYSLNRILNPLIAIIELKEVAEDFNTRYDAVRKTYLYVIEVGKFNPILKDLVYHPIFKFDLKLFEEVSNLFVGLHHFDAFGSEEIKEGKLREIETVSVTKCGDYIFWRVTGRSFYRYQVRYMVGTAYNIAAHRLDVSEITTRLSGDNDITCHHKAPAHGLYLERTEYDFQRSEHVT